MFYIYNHSDREYVCIPTLKEPLAFFREDAAESYAKHLSKTIGVTFVTEGLTERQWFDLIT